jgi:hypothetical protein
MSVFIWDAVSKSLPGIECSQLRQLEDFPDLSW